jgi:hypothetical protein
MKVGEYVQLKYLDGQNRFGIVIIASPGFVVLKFEATNRKRRPTYVIKVGKAKST